MHNLGKCHNRIQIAQSLMNAADGTVDFGATSGDCRMLVPNMYLTLTTCAVQLV